jgi:pimeloyl-ACP methyl ester carboxylesterase
MARAPRGPALRGVLLPGIDGSGALYAPLVAAGPRAFRPELVSYPPDAPLGYDELAALVRPRLAGGPFALLAESFSGPLAVRLAAERPAGLVALVLAATFLHAPLHPALHPIRALVGARFFGLALPAPVVRWFMAGTDAPDALVAEVRRAVAAVSPEVMAHRAAEALRVDVREALARVDVPLLVVVPTRDRLLRNDLADEVLTVRPDAEIALVDAPHMVLQRCPHASLARVEEFLARAGGGVSRRGAARRPPRAPRRGRPRRATR